MMKNLIVLLVFGALLTIFSGCKEDHGTRPVTIKMIRHDKPVVGATISIVPTDGSGKGASGTTNDSGIAKMTTGQGFPGAWPGDYQVTVALFEMKASQSATGDGTLVNHLPEKYNSPTTSGLTLNVDDRKGANISFNLDE